MPDLSGAQTAKKPPEPRVQIYVEIRIQGEMDDLWRLTQTPEHHESWDLRFSSIEYLPATSEAADEPQRFRYATRLGGLQVSGWGETVGESGSDAKRSSALRFGSDESWALIRSGSGYWKYEQLEGELRFITGYDYEPRWGIVGRVIDRFAFRPLIGWATAWSFDRLRLWIEEGLHPRLLARQALVHAVATGSLAFAWFWHGLVPKLLWPHADEMAILTDAGIAAEHVLPLVRVAGGLEVLAGILVLSSAHQRWPFLLTMLLIIGATVGVLVNSPQYALAAFNPITLNLFMAAAAAIALLTLRDLPSARRCLRKPPKKRKEPA